MNKNEYNDMDRLIDQVLNEEPEFQLSVDFADHVTRKVGDRMLRKRLVTEYAMKVGVIVIPLLILTGIFFYISPQSIQSWVSTSGGEFLPYILFIVLIAFIVFADQVILRFFLLRRK